MIIDNRECYKSVTHQIITLKDPTNPKNKRGPTLKFLNVGKNSVRIGQIDGCLITNQDIRCDFEVFAEKKLSSFVELKGSDIEHAIDQIKNSIRLIGFSEENNRVCFIICNRCPMSSTQIQLFKKFFLKHYQSKLEVKESGFEFAI